MTRLTESRHPAYHLRPNKAVDRMLFLDIIHALNLYCNISDHTYVGFGGPFLEDFRMLSNRFPNLKLLSIENDEQTFKRQDFHKCCSNLTLHYCEFKDFLSTDFPTGHTITWADYTDFNREALLEISDITRLSTPTSLIRITVPAESPVYRKLHLLRNARHLTKKKEKEFTKWVESYRKSVKIQDIAYDKLWFVYDNFRHDNYPYLLSKIISSVIDGSCSPPKIFLPLHGAVYSDGTKMLSLTGVFCPEENLEEMKSHFQKQGIINIDPDGKQIEVIDVPVLTTKERLFLEKLLPIADDCTQECLNKLGYLIEGDESEKLSAYKMEQYEKYYRYYPYFGKMVP